MLTRRQIEECKRLTGKGVPCPKCSAMTFGNIMSHGGQVIVTCPKCGDSDRWPVSSESDAIFALLAEREELIELLKKIDQSIRAEKQPVCPFCGPFIAPVVGPEGEIFVTGHTPSCELAAFLR